MTKFLLGFLLLFSFTKAFSQTADSFYTNPERPAEYPAGGTALEYFLTENIIYPQSAIKDKVSGTVELKLWIDRLGRLVRTEVVKPLYPALDTEAMNVAAMIPRWRAAMQSGYHVSSTINLPVRFVLPLSPTNLVRRPDRGPEYPGGAQASLKFLRKNMSYPENAIAHEKQGRVVVRFIIDEKGHVVKPAIVKPLVEPIDNEVLRVVQLMQWKPAVQDGKAVSVYYTMPVDFQIENARTVITEQQLLVPLGNGGNAFGN